MRLNSSIIIYTVILCSFSTHVDTLLCNTLCQYGNISEHLIDGSNLTQFWKRARIFIPFTTDYELVSDYIIAQFHTITTYIASQLYLASFQKECLK